MSYSMWHYPPSASQRERRQIDCEMAEKTARDNLDFLLGRGALASVRQILNDYHPQAVPCDFTRKDVG